jgi:hypothetical protein
MRGLPESQFPWGISSGQTQSRQTSTSLENVRLFIIAVLGKLNASPNIATTTELPARS